MATEEPSDALSNCIPSAVWDTPIVLSLDGGGIRGLSTLLILKYIFIEVAKLEADQHHDLARGGKAIARPCHYLDHMVGTSTGGLISILLGRMRLSIQEAIDVYADFARRVFGERYGLRITRYSARELERVFREVTNRHCKHLRKCNGTHESFLQPDIEVHRRRCVTIVVATKRKFKHPNAKLDKAQSDVHHLFRSYRHFCEFKPDLGSYYEAVSTDPGTAIWEVARATTAARPFFPKMYIGNDPFLDGGFIANNPVSVALANARQVAPSPRHRLDTLISIGTGVPRKPSHFSRPPVLGAIPGVRGLVAAARVGVKSLTDTNPPHEAVSQTVSVINRSDPDHPISYWRFNVTDGLEDIALNEWKTHKPNSTLRQLGRAPFVAETPPLDDGDVPFLKDFNPNNVTMSRIEHTTRVYLLDNQVAIRACAAKLARLARERRHVDLSHWRYYTGEWEGSAVSKTPGREHLSGQPKDLAA